LNQEIFALIDTGCELSIMNEHLYNRLRHEGLKCLELPTQHINLLSAFSKKSNRIKKQATLEVNIGNVKVNQIVLLSPQLLTNAILGLDFLVECNAVINMAERSMTTDTNGECNKVRFIGDKGTTEDSREVDKSAGKFGPYNCVIEPECPCQSPLITADRGQRHTDCLVKGLEENMLVPHQKGGMSESEKREREIGVIIPRRVSARDEKVEIASQSDESCWDDRRNEVPLH